MLYEYCVTFGIIREKQNAVKIRERECPSGLLSWSGLPAGTNTIEK